MEYYNIFDFYTSGAYYYTTSLDDLIRDANSTNRFLKSKNDKTYDFTHITFEEVEELFNISKEMEKERDLSKIPYLKKYNDEYVLIRPESVLDYNIDYLKFVKFITNVYSCMQRFVKNKMRIV